MKIDDSTATFLPMGYRLATVIENQTTPFLISEPSQALIPPIHHMVILG